MDNNNQISEIKERLDIVQVVEKYVQLKQAGKNYSGLCPFHREKTPSFIVSPEMQRFKCFGCNESGDVFNFVQKIENLDFPETLEKLAKLAGVELKKRETNYKYKNLEEINYIATKHYYKQLSLNKKALEYVLNRGISKESIKSFGIGYAPQKGQLLRQINLSKKYSRNDLLQSGLFTEKNGIVKEKFYDRIMFPIRSKKGSVIGFTGRILPGNDWGPKYMNTPETPIFHKKNNLFAQYEARQEIRKQDLAIICEGSTDVIAAHQYGFKNTVAPLGTSLTKEQLESISLLTKNLLLFFDSDKAGQEALVRAFKLSSSLNMNPYAATSAPYKDIDEMVQKEPNKMKELVEKKTEAFSFILENTLKGKDLNKLQDINDIKKFILPMIESVANPDAKNLYSKKFFEITKITPNKIFLQNPTKIQQEKTSSSFHIPVLTTTHFAKYVQLIILSDLTPEEKLLPERFFEGSGLEDLYRFISQKHSSKGHFREEIFTHFEANKGVKHLLEEIIFNATEFPSDQEELKNEMKQLEKNIKITYYTNLQKNLTSQIAMGEEMKEKEKEENLLKKLYRITKILKDIENE